MVYARGNHIMTENPLQRLYSAIQEEQQTNPSLPLSLLVPDRAFGKVDKGMGERPIYGFPFHRTAKISKSK